MPVRILVADDEENVRYLVESALQAQGFETVSTSDGMEALRIIDEGGIDVAVLDVMMPGMDGFTAVRRARESGSKVPVIFLTARTSTDDRVQGLTIGGDDYLVKPFAVAELVARVRLQLRRVAEVAGVSHTLQCADLEMDTEAHRVTRSGVHVPLSPTEYKLLHYLLINSGRVVTRGQVLDRVWNYDFDGDSNVVDTFISYLRRKVDTVEPKLIHTVRGVGFSLRVEP